MRKGEKCNTIKGSCALKNDVFIYASFGILTALPRDFENIFFRLPSKNDLKEFKIDKNFFKIMTKIYIKILSILSFEIINTKCC